ncbi:hypothetical protein BN439_1953 [Erwinia amylovora Ea644]|nr:hypothetical protein BN439_1953 [Erwinia amylovora Ea644]
MKNLLWMLSETHSMTQLLWKELFTTLKIAAANKT